MNAFNPMEYLQTIQKEAVLSGDSNARYCTLGTLEAEDDSQLRMRTLVVRNLSDKGCLLFVNRQAQKNLMDLNKRKIEVLFFYPTLMAQFRLRGTLSLMDNLTLSEHWQRKPYEAKLLDHFYATFQAQSSELASRSILDAGLEELKKQYPDPNSVPFSADAIGLQISANYIEVWQGADNGIHDRRLFTITDKQWQEHIIVP